MPSAKPKAAQTQRGKWILLSVLLFLCLIGVGFEVYAQQAPYIRGSVLVGSTPVGGLQLATAEQLLTQTVPAKLAPAINLIIDNKQYPIPSDAIDLNYDTKGALRQAWEYGRSLNPLKRFGFLILSRLNPAHVELSPSFNPDKLRDSIAAIALTIDEPGKDIRLHAIDSELVLLTDTSTGFVVDQAAAYAAVTDALRNDQTTTKPLALKVVEPTVQVDQARETETKIARAIKQPITLTHEWTTFTLQPSQLASWVTSISDGPALKADFDNQAISAYVTTIAQGLNAEPQAPKITVVDGKVTDFIAPRTGTKLDQDKTIADILSLLEQREQGADPVTKAAIDLAVTTQKAAATDESAAALGITELIGSATTPLTGSPKNRIANIKNGAHFLTGLLVKPGEEFSTLKALGAVDNTTGYLPELVIKGDATVPEFGGGLCQVSTTLFRAILNTGLPITARTNHSYRVVYYEKDGEGNYIGPGLDATIYQPAPDFKFMNDTSSNILLQAHVDGDFLTFDIYGTKDGRTSKIDGPHTLTVTPAGDPIYTATDTLAPGEQKQTEHPHPGGSATATYTITYADGTTKQQVFKSFYRPWPARFLVGTDANHPLPSASTTPATIP